MLQKIQDDENIEALVREAASGKLDQDKVLINFREEPSINLSDLEDQLSQVGSKKRKPESSPAGNTSSLPPKKWKSSNLGVRRI